MLLFKKRNPRRCCPLPSSFSLFYAASPGLVGINLLICLKSRPAAYLHPPLLFLPLTLFKKESLCHRSPVSVNFLPFFLLIHPDWLMSTFWSISSLGELCVYARLCCFHPWLCSKKKSSVFIFPFFSIASPGLVDINLLLYLKSRPVVCLRPPLLFSSLPEFKKESLWCSCPFSIYFPLFFILLRPDWLTSPSNPVGFTLLFLFQKTL